MSRSYKKYPFVKDKSGSKHGKKFANKKVRHAKNLPNGKAYKKVYESWDICDYKYLWTRKDAIEDWLSSKPNSWKRKHFKTLEDYLKYWEKCVKRK